MKMKKLKLFTSFLIVFLVEFVSCSQDFYPFGLNANDKKLEYTMDQSAIALDVPIIFMEKSVDEIYLSHNGIIGLGHRVPEKIEPLQRIKNPIIAVFYAPVSEGNIFYRVTSSDQTLLKHLTNAVKQVFADATDFHALQAILITWTDIQNAEKDGSASFQLVIISDGISTYSIVHYGQLPWSSSMGYYAQTGFVHSEGKIQTNVNSGGPDVKELVNLSNNQFGNSFIFRISGSAIEDPRDEGADEYDYNNYDQEYDGETPSDCPKDKYLDNCPEDCRFVRDERGCPRCLCADKPALPKEAKPEDDSDENDEQDKEESNRDHQISGTKYETLETGKSNTQISKMTCSQRDEKSCHVNSNCQDFENGFCCNCDTGYYGNGKECLSKGEPQRITGSFEGVINRIPIDRTELHTFATATDGNVYTAVSKIPSDLGHPLLLVNSIGSVMGWLFAEVQSTSVYNGFQLTGGLFNRTAAIHIGQKYYVTIRQEFSGRSIYDYFNSHIFVSGTLPDIAPGSEVIFPDYEEEYVREKRGYLTSKAAFDVIIKDSTKSETIRMAIDQQISFDECPFKEFERDQTMKLHVKRVNVVYNSDEGVVRYGSRNYATKSSFDRRQHGHTQLPSSEPLAMPSKSKIVIGTDACSNGNHQCTQPNMKCRVVEPSYRCECEPGYQANHDKSSPIGWGCVDLDECQRGDHNCDRNGKCTNRPGTFSCECLAGFIGDGRTCIKENVSNEDYLKETSLIDKIPTIGSNNQGECTAHNQCHQWGECVFTSEHPTGRCKCRGWYVGDGVNHCGPPDEKNKVLMNANIPQNNGQPCGNYVCDLNAECLPEPSGSSECVCKAGFTGNGLRCESLLDESSKHYSDDQNQHQQQLGKVCRSHDECSEHGSCAYHNSLGYYQCTCTEPYVGNGVECNLPGALDTDANTVGCDVTKDCSEFADCVYERTAHGAHFKCVCQSGYTGDGKYCMQSQLALSPAAPQLPPLIGASSCQPNCDSNAQCIYDDFNKFYKCECYAAFIGDGYKCERLIQPTLMEKNQPKTCVESSDCNINGHCILDENGAGEYICQCLPGFTGDGFINCQIADQCNPSNPTSCHQNSQCVFDETKNAHICQCVDGFKGENGVNCVPYAPATNCQIDPRICHSNAQCILRHETNNYECLCKPGSSGDGYSKCDVIETPRCTNCSIHAFCSQNPSNGAYQCKCNAGFNGNGYLCVSMTTCFDDRSLCDANADCVPGEAGHYVCNCHYGYHGDGRTCSPDSSGRNEKLLIARGMAIFERSTNPDEYGKQLIVIPHHIPVGIDFDCQDEKIVWSDMAGHSIRFASLNGTNHKSILSKELSSPEGIAVDWSSRNVYYADSMNDEIGVASLNGKYKKSLITEGLVNPRSLAIDLNGRQLYYSDWHRENPYIGRVDLDGRNNRVFLNDDVHLPNGLTILPNRRELCWVDAGNHRLSCILFNGSARRTVFSNLQYPFGLTHENELKLYWTDWKDNRIHSIGIYGDGYRSFQISLGGSGKVFGILSVPNSCVGAQTPCSVDNGGCAHLCLPGQNGAVCECPDNVKVKGC